MEMCVGNTDSFHLLALPKARRYCELVTCINTCNPHNLTHWVSAVIINYYPPYFIDEEAKTQKHYLAQSPMASEWQS